MAELINHFPKVNFAYSNPDKVQILKMLIQTNAVELDSPPPTEGKISIPSIGTPSSHAPIMLLSDTMNRVIFNNCSPIVSPDINDSVITTWIDADRLQVVVKGLDIQFTQQDEFQYVENYSCLFNVTRLQHKQGHIQYPSVQVHVLKEDTFLLSSDKLFYTMDGISLTLENYVCPLVENKLSYYNAYSNTIEY